MSTPAFLTPFDVEWSAVEMEIGGYRAAYIVMQGLPKRRVYGFPLIGPDIELIKGLPI
ncbi:hypothetical protein J3Q64DRAFT_1827287 [Phycomyces blakesleeanus]|uniref:Uncharacterized protein n=2 Tax=Phycomyces blakesleeanus TaxID=4837 RepID=A0A167PDF5_PHYB8|nr:hypothetical protein PHYBLDRAFT_141572 [Phycomyces blakesleeanus NRRL 1555(-)]XP_018295856.1 hypothetical protein PHYBLDRAFT_141677 [Phycomyces blakesleeanus NRRL 1555(-)]OAD77707.1 hypothetical protein PHYBLDRAFT_141572 [Phycomyces blakesleeanus NRRL 1555(-)]OAD77816.1 hypothetical protein PHYBLDRAFT_141677 [Phycomyces blakesleeanus NRRL 1555(-)]|eukprot:XP_018295747.1 hypothetical protein PHYBLDRAFT_141572 [Phycomyces blakesleeanus NRRL 1555(-)]